MDIYFRTQKLAKLCNAERLMKKELGDKIAKKLQQRLFELKAADSLADVSHLPLARLHELSLNRKGQYPVDLVHPFRLLFIAANEDIYRLESGGVDRKRVTEIEIIAIIDTHRG